MSTLGNAPQWAFKKLALTLIFSAAFLTCFAGAGKASGITCVVPDTVTLDILPAGCMAVLTNGPITYTGVTDSGGDIHNIEVDQFEFFSLNNNANTLEVFQQGTDTDVTSGIVTPFAFVTPSVFFQTNPSNNDYSPDMGTQTFGIQHFIDNFDPGVGVLKLNFGESGKPNQYSLETVQSSADDTTSPGNFTVSSFFDIFTEISLNRGANYTVADDDFTANGGTGPGAQFQVENTPEPASAALFSAGLAVWALALWRKKASFHQVA